MRLRRQLRFPDVFAEGKDKSKVLNTVLIEVAQAPQA